MPSPKHVFRKGRSEMRIRLHVVDDELHLQIGPVFHVLSTDIFWDLMIFSILLYLACTVRCAVSTM